MLWTRKTNIASIENCYPCSCFKRGGPLAQSFLHSTFCFHWSRSKRTAALFIETITQKEDWTHPLSKAAQHFLGLSKKSPTTITIISISIRWHWQRVRSCCEEEEEGWAKNVCSLEKSRHLGFSSRDSHTWCLSSASAWRRSCKKEFSTQASICFKSSSFPSSSRLPINYVHNSRVQHRALFW